MNGLRPIAESWASTCVPRDQLVNHAASASMFGGQFECPLRAPPGRRAVGPRTANPGRHFAHGLLVAPSSSSRRQRFARRHSCDDPVLFIEQATMYSDKGEVPDDPTCPARRQERGETEARMSPVTYSKMARKRYAAQQLAAEASSANIDSACRARWTSSRCTKHQRPTAPSSWKMAAHLRPEREASRIYATASTTSTPDAWRAAFCLPAARGKIRPAKNGRRSPRSKVMCDEFLAEHPMPNRLRP